MHAQFLPPDHRPAVIPDISRQVTASSRSQQFQVKFPGSRSVFPVFGKDPRNHGPEVFPLKNRKFLHFTVETAGYSVIPDQDRVCCWYRERRIPCRQTGSSVRRSPRAAYGGPEPRNRSHTFGTGQPSGHRSFPDRSRTEWSIQNTGRCQGLYTGGAGRERKGKTRKPQSVPASRHNRPDHGANAGKNSDRQPGHRSARQGGGHHGAFFGHHRYHVQCILYYYVQRHSVWLGIMGKGVFTEAIRQLPVLRMPE